MLSLHWWFTRYQQWWNTGRFQLYYPPELKLNCEDKNDQEVNYLELSLNIKNSSIQYRLYDKRDKFGFRIVNFPDLSEHPNWTVIRSFYISTGSLCPLLSTVCALQRRTLHLVKSLLKQGFKFHKFMSYFYQISRKNSYLPRHKLIGRCPEGWTVFPLRLHHNLNVTK